MAFEAWQRILPEVSVRVVIELQQDRAERIHFSLGVVAEDRNRLSGQNLTPGWLIVSR